MNINTQYEPISVCAITECAYYLPQRNIIFFVRGEGSEKHIVGHLFNNSKISFTVLKETFPSLLAKRIEEVVRKREILFSKPTGDVDKIVEQIDHQERVNALAFEKFMQKCRQLSLIEFDLDEYGTYLSK